MSKHNAKCPICQRTWSFNVSKAILDENEKQDLMKHGDLNVVCEDCCHKEDEIDEAAIKLLKQGRVLSFAI